MESPNPGSVRRWRTAKMLLLGILVSTGAMLVSYATVRVLAQRIQAPGTQSGPGDAREQRLLAVAERLGGLAERFVEHIPVDGVGFAPEAQRWVQTVFRSELEALRRELEAPAFGSDPSVRTLLEAVERGLHLAAHPEDRGLRRQAISQMQAADRSTWEYLTGDGQD